MTWFEKWLGYKMYIRYGTHQISRTCHGQWGNRPLTRITDEDLGISGSEKEIGRVVDVRHLWFVQPACATLCQDSPADESVCQKYQMALVTNEQEASRSWSVFTSWLWTPLPCKLFNLHTAASEVGVDINFQWKENGKRKIIPNTGRKIISAQGTYSELNLSVIRKPVQAASRVW